MIDVGADLGFLGIELLRTKLVQQVWNIELSKYALQKSRELYLLQQLEDKAKFIYSDGFSFIEPDIDLEIERLSYILITLAGLGSKKIISILSKFPNQWAPKELWLCSLSHTSPFKLLDWALLNQWELKRENVFELRNKSYSLLLFRKK